MATTKELQDRVHAVIEGVLGVEEVFNGTIPPHTSVRQFPAVAIDYAEQKRQRSQVSGNAFDIQEEIDLYLYIKVKRNEEDNQTADYIDSINKSLMEDETLLGMTIDHYINSVNRDGGILAPYYLTRLTLFLQYRAVC